MMFLMLCFRFVLEQDTGETEQRDKKEFLLFRTSVPPCPVALFVPVFQPISFESESDLVPEQYLTLEASLVCVRVCARL